jgi:hypothetical protein
MIGLGLSIPEIAVRGSGLPPWLLAPGGVIPDLDLDFANGRAWTKTKGLILPASLLTVTRASQETIVDLSGNVTYAPNGSGVGGGLGAALSNAGLQAWESRTNLLLSSQDFTNVGFWGQTDVTATISGTAPDGRATANLITEDTANNYHLVFYGPGITVASGAPATMSLWLKAGTRRFVSFGVTDTGLGNQYFATLDTIAGTVATNVVGTGTVAAATVKAYANGWFFVSVTGAIPATTTYFPDIAGSPSSTPANLFTGYLGTGKTIIAWGAQLEAASFASPYIPTTSSTVMRAADVVTLTNVPTFGTSASAVIWSSPNAPVSSSALQAQLTITNMSNQTQRFGFFKTNVTGAAAYFYNAGNGITGAPLWTPGVVGKAAMNINPAGAVVAFNGGNLTTLSAAGISGFTNVNLGTDQNSGVNGNTNISRIAIWATTALSAGALQQVTT